MSGAESAEAIAQRLLDASLGTIDILSVYLGDRLGWYRSLSKGPATPAELATRTGTSERYAREWLEQQAVTGLLNVDAGQSEERRFSISAGAAEVLTDTDSLSYLAPLARMLAGAAVQLPSLVKAYRTGAGVGWAEYGADARESQADMNRPWFENRLADALTAAPALWERLRAPGIRIADIGCGAGWSSIALSRAFPSASVEGFDVDSASLALARANADASDAREGGQLPRN
ncbi:class I SAM-dependent methyltransferase [Arthrobacter sp. H5]|uniref:methyltransferase n=1 Tax=Arthrobacter sp. H5 TaxID=1267973 RepID=UPI0004AC59AD|nr:class I SAM-dependent methyltransferase [Arthrobacter sp. H5]